MYTCLNEVEMYVLHEKDALGLFYAIKKKSLLSFLITVKQSAAV